MSAPVPPAPHSFTPQDSIGLHMRCILTDLASAIDRRMEPLGLTDAQWKPLLSLLWEQPISAATLASRCHIDAGGLTRLLDKLEAKGLCQRQRAPQDRRVVLVALTEQGNTIAAQLPAILQHLQTQLLDGFSPADTQRLRQDLARLQENIRQL